VKQSRRVLLFFGLMVLLPALVFGALIVRTVRTERMQATQQRLQTEREIVRLIEADLNDWLFSADGAGAKASVRFHLRGDQVVFPDHQLTLPATGSPPRPSTPPPPGEPADADVILDFYYPRILTFLRDFKSGAQYFLRLRALVVLLPGRDEGYVLDASQVLDYIDGRLAGYCGAARCRGALWIADFRDMPSQPGANTFALEGYPFFQLLFYEPEPGRLSALRQHGFVYSMALLVIVAILGSILVYRGVSQEARFSKLRADFVSAVSHEFRSPLTSILALSERLTSSRVRDSATLAEYHHLIARDARRLSALVTRLLDFAQIEDGRKIYSLERVELVGLVREAIQSGHHGARPDRLRLRGEEAAPLWVQADRTALEHCVQNLVDNAAKYSPPDAPITVTCAASDGHAVVDVEDRGIGISPEEHRRIFEKFYRAPAASELNAEGVGIGLALVKHVMEGHGGSVSVVSQPGQGSRFRLALPCSGA